MRAGVIGICLLLAASAAVAQENAFELSMEELLDLKITIASRNAQSPLDAPSTVSVITRRELDALGIRTLEQLADYVPGLRSYRWVSNSNQGHTFAPRGVPVPSSNGVLFLFDGHRLNVEQTGGPVFSRYISLASVERVEIIRGPGSALYGSNAFQAVVNLITDGGANLLAVEAGTSDGRRALLRHRRELGELQVALTVEHQSDGGERYRDAFDPAHPLQPSQTQDPQSGDEAVASLRWRDWRALWRESRTRSEDFYLLGGLAPDGGFVDVRDRLFAIGNDALSIGGQWHGSVHVDYKRGYTDSLAQLVAQGVPPFVEAPWMAGTRVVFEHWEAGTDWRWDIAPDSRLNVGATFIHVPEPYAFIRSNYTNVFPPQYLGDVRTLTDESGLFLTPVSRRSRGVYVQYQRELAQRWQASVGVRHDSYSDVGSATTPRAALIWTSPWQGRIKLMYGRAFRAPTYSELYFRNNPVLLGNPDLDPSRIETFELGYVHGGPRATWSATAYDSRIEDFIARRQLPNGQQVQTFNIGSVRTRGIELEGQWQIGDAWRTRATFTRLFDQGQSFVPDAVASDIAAQTPEQWGSLALIYDRARWQLSASTLYTGATPLLAPQSGYWIANATARWRATDTVDLTLRIDNAFDEAYDTIADDTGLGRDENGDVVRNVPNRGRFAWVGVEWRY